jgi:hypothetical protein
MTTTTVEHAARDHAKQIRDPQHREALAKLLEDLAYIYDEIGGGLHVAAPDGLKVNPLVDMNLRFGSDVATELARLIRDGEQWMTEAAALRREEDRINRLGQREQVICVTPEDWRLRRAEGFAAGVDALAQELAASDSDLVDA